MREPTRRRMAWSWPAGTDTVRLGPGLAPGPAYGKFIRGISGFGIFDHLSIIVHLISVLVVVQFFHGKYQLQTAGEGAAAVEAVHVEVVHVEVVHIEVVHVEVKF